MWKYNITLILVVLLCVSCTNRHNEEIQRETEIPVSLCIPMSSEFYSHRSAARRIPGDPGKTEMFALPSYAYIFVLIYQDSKWKMLDIFEEIIPDEEWNPTHYIGLYKTEGDSIYHYTKKLQIMLEGQNVTGRAYAIASPVPLVFNKTLNSSAITDLDDLLELKIDISDDDTRDNLHNIYTTPYNYELSSVYYGTFDNNNTNVAPLNLLLYHIAAKVDITWNVDDEKRVNREHPEDAIRLTSMKACNLFNGNAYCFKPMENSSGASPLAPEAGTGDTITLVRPSDEGLWWEGRSYFYTIPYTTTADGKGNYFPLQMEMETNGSGDKYRPTIYMEVNKSQPFVPWLRATFNINNLLEDETDEKTAPLTIDD